MAPLLVGADHTKGNSPEEPVEANDDRIQNREDAPANLLVEVPCGPVQAEAHGKDGEPQRRVVVVDVGDTAHGHEGEVVKDPTDDGVDTSVVDLVHLGLLEVVVAALPTDNVPDDDESEDTKTGCAAPVDEWVTEEEVLDDWELG